jgi:hypothetical protein
MMKMFLQQRNGHSTFIRMESKRFPHGIRSYLSLNTNGYCRIVNNPICLLTSNWFFRFRRLEQILVMVEMMGLDKMEHCFFYLVEDIVSFGVFFFKYFFISLICFISLSASTYSIRSCLSTILHNAII